MPHVNQADVAPDGSVRNIVDRVILARVTGYAVATIRKWCRPLDYDPETGRALYDVDVVRAQLKDAGVEPRPSTRGPRTRPSWRR